MGSFKTTLSLCLLTLFATSCGGRFEKAPDLTTLDSSHVKGRVTAEEHIRFKFRSNCKAFLAQSGVDNEMNRALNQMKDLIVDKNKSLLSPRFEMDELCLFADMGTGINAYAALSESTYGAIVMGIPLMATLRNVDELAFIIAHEIAHYTMSHILAVTGSRFLYSEDLLEDADAKEVMKRLDEHKLNLDKVAQNHFYTLLQLHEKASEFELKAALQGMLRDLSYAADISPFFIPVGSRELEEELPLYFSGLADLRNQLARAEQGGASKEVMKSLKKDHKKELKRVTKLVRQFLEDKEELTDKWNANTEDKVAIMEEVNGEYEILERIVPLEKRIGLMEKEADEVALELVWRAGFDVRNAADAILSLDKKKCDDNVPFSMTLDNVHPESCWRAQNLHREIEKHGYLEPAGI